MKKVLLIGYPFPLRHGGSPRLLGLAKYLPEFGWQPIILTAPLSSKADGKVTIVETGYRETLGFWKRRVFKLNANQDDRAQLKQRFGITSQKSLLDWLLTRVGEIVNYPDSDKGWRPFAVEAGSKIIPEGGFAAMISSSAPVTGHIIAKELKLKHNLPWVADLRDPWTQNHNYIYSRLRKWFDTRLELDTLSAADALVTVSQPWAEQLGSLHQGKKVYSIPNGFDPESVNIPPAKLTAKFTLTYTGTIYAGKQDPAKLFGALKDLIADGSVNRNDIEVRFYGPEIGWLTSQIVNYGLADVVRCFGMVSQQAALEKQRESQILLLLDWDDPAEKGVYPLKIFEYLAARRPILATGGISDNTVSSLLTETGAGVQAVTAIDIKEALKEFYGQFKSLGKVPDRTDESRLDKYSYREMARMFSSILDGLASTGRTASGRS